MVDPIGIAKSIIGFGMKIKEITDEVKAFKEYAKRVQFKIEHLMPPLETIIEMENQQEAFAAAQKNEPEMKAFTKSLSQMLNLVEEVKLFIEGLRGMSKFQQATKKEKIKEKFETYDLKLDTLQRSIHMGVLVEFKKEADAGRKQDSVKIFVRHIKKASASHGSPTPDIKDQFKLSDDIPIIASDDLEPIRKLGEGGFGEVWLSKYKQGEQVAVKIFDVGNNRSLLKEVAKMRQAIFSPYIVRLRGLVDEHGMQGIVMDYLENGSLKSFLPYLECDCWPRRVCMLCDIASGINYLHTDHTPPLVHRDIKLSNMFVDHGFTVKIGDLGLASSGTTITRSRSQACLMGTYSHMAPELWNGTAEDAEPSLDIYGFGISIYELITGKSPWPPAVKLDEIRGLVVSGERPNLASIKADTPSEVVTMMQRCWHTDPKARPTSQEILQGFSMLYESHYEAGRLQADKVIRGKIEADMGASSKQRDGPSTEDSGIKSDFQESFEETALLQEDEEPRAQMESPAANNGSIGSDGHMSVKGHDSKPRATEEGPSAGDTSSRSGNMNIREDENIHAVTTESKSQDSLISPAKDSAKVKRNSSMTIGIWPVNHQNKNPLPPLLRPVPPKSLVNTNPLVSNVKNKITSECNSSVHHDSLVANKQAPASSTASQLHQDDSSSSAHQQPSHPFKRPVIPPPHPVSPKTPVNTNPLAIHFKNQVVSGSDAHQDSSVSNKRTVASSTTSQSPQHESVSSTACTVNLQPSHPFKRPVVPPQRPASPKPPVNSNATVNSKKTSELDSSAAHDSSGNKQTASDKSDMRWQHRYTIIPGGRVYACQMISENHLAVCMEKGCVKVYQVSAEGSNHAYTVKSNEWKTLTKWKDIKGVAMSESSPNSMLVICEDKPYVYQCPFHEAIEVKKKYKIESDEKDPYCIVANANTAVINMRRECSFIMCKIPGLTQQIYVQVDFYPHDLSISSDYLLVMGYEQIVVKTLSNVTENVSRIKPPDGWAFTSVCCKNNAMEIYAACMHREKGNRVYRYTWNGAGESKYGNPTCIIEGLQHVGTSYLSVTSDGLLAVGQDKKVQIHNCKS